MVLSKLKIAAGVLAATAALTGANGVVPHALAHKPPEPKKPAVPIAAAPTTPPAKEAPASKLDLTPETFAKLRAAIRPQGNEWRHLQIHWYTDIVAARKKAAAEDKPILAFRTGGAGYNDPLGQC